MRLSGVDWCNYVFNFFAGCIHDCLYCYAKDMNRQVRWTDDWKNPKLLKNNEERFRGLVKQPKGKVFFEDIGDAYQAVDWILRQTRFWLERLLQSKHEILILTKSNLVEKDYDLILQYKNVQVGFTIVSLTKNPYEPYAPPPELRIQALKKAKNLGIKTFISLEPWLKDYTNPIIIVEKLMDTVDWWIVGSHNYKLRPLHPEYYKTELPKLVEFMDKHGVNYFIKKELSPFLTEKSQGKIEKWF
ncbi:MAG: DUF5131 family protein [Candidatus Bathyarchaeota archaeon]